MVAITYSEERRNDYAVGTILAMVLTGLSYLIALWQKWITTVDWLEILAVSAAYACTYLCVVQKRFNYVLGAVSTAAFSLLFWRADLIASTLLNLYLTPQLVYGWFRWRRDEITRLVTRVNWRSAPLYILATGLFYLGATTLVDLAGGAMAGWDVIILIGSILAQFLLDNKKLETWAAWALVNIVAIGVYWTNDLKITALQYVFFLGNTYYGYYSWKKTYA